MKENSFAKMFLVIRRVFEDDVCLKVGGGFEGRTSVQGKVLDLSRFPAKLTEVGVTFFIFIICVCAAVPVAHIHNKLMRELLFFF